MIKLSYAEADITPVNGEDLCGFALRQPGSHGVHDPLKVKWLTLRDDSGQSYLLGSADIISVSQDSYKELEARIRGQLEVPPAGVGFATTHTHSGPVTVTLRNCGRMSEPYVDRMNDTIVSTAVQAAGESHKPVKVLVGHSTSDEGENRRLGDRGQIDQDVTAISFVDPDTGNPIATLVNFACHPVVLGHINELVSADYPGYMTSFVERNTGAPCLFLNGACGDINPRRGDHSADPEDARDVGESVGASVLQALAAANEVPAESIRWHTQKVDLPFYQFQSEEELESRLDMLQQTFPLARDLFTERLDNDKGKMREGSYPRTITIELAYLELGPEIGILFVPGELFTSIGLKFKEILGPRHVLISAFSNGSIGYLPDRAAYTDGGNAYEPFFANFFYDFPQLDPSTEDALIDGVKALAGSIRSADAMKTP